MSGCHDNHIMVSFLVHASLPAATVSYFSSSFFFFFVDFLRVHARLCLSGTLLEVASASFRL